LHKEELNIQFVACTGTIIAPNVFFLSLVDSFFKFLIATTHVLGTITDKM